jgi:hypothetical protein
MVHQLGFAMTDPTELLREPICISGIDAETVFAPHHGVAMDISRDALGAEAMPALEASEVSPDFFPENMQTVGISDNDVDAATNRCAHSSSSDLGGDSNGGGGCADGGGRAVTKLIAAAGWDWLPEMLLIPRLPARLSASAALCLYALGQAHPEVDRCARIAQASPTAHRVSTWL